MIIVDIHRDEDNIAKKLENFGVEVKRESISNDFYIVTEKRNIMVERKDTRDYIMSLRNGSLFKQLKTCDLLVIEGDWVEAIKWKNTKYYEINGSIASIYIKWNMPVIHVMSQGQLADLLMRIEKELGPSSPSKIYYPRKVGTVDDKTRPAYILKGFEGVGDRTAEDLLESFGSVKDVVNAEIDDLMKIKGIGKAKAKKIYGVARTKFIKPKK